MAKQSCSPSSSFSPSFEKLFEGPFPELLESLEDQGVELGIFLSIQPLSSCPPPTLDTGSPADFGPESPDNHIQTPKSYLTTNDQLGLVIYPSNPLFDPVVISP